MAGTGATLGTPVLATPSFPRTTTYFQQRQAFAGFSQAPDEVAMSRSGDYPNFGYSSPAKDDDAIQFTVASTQLNAIKHLISLNSLIVLTDSGAFKVDAAQQGAAITPTSYQVTPQVYNGASDVTPLVINYDILYVQARGSIVRDLSYNFYVNLYTGTDITALSNHLFYGRQIIEWAYAEEPFKIVWAVRDDGMLLSLTYLKEQDVMGWAHSDTLGRFKSVCSIIEDNENAVYFIVERFIGDQYVQYYERLASRQMGGDPTIEQPGDVERAFFVDAGLRYPLRTLNAQLTPVANPISNQIIDIDIVNAGMGYVDPMIIVTDETGSGAVIMPIVMGGQITACRIDVMGQDYARPTVTVYDKLGGGGAICYATVGNVVTMNADADVFAAGDLGAVVRINDGRGTIIGLPSTRQVTTRVDRPLSAYWPSPSGSWTCTRPVTVVRGLDHLNGMTVAILADGNVQPQQVVVSGSITLLQPASAIVIGLPYQGQVKTLSIDLGGQPTNQTKRMKVSAVGVRMQDSRGLKVGHDFDDTVIAFKERNATQQMGQAIDLITGDERVVMDPLWKTPGQIVVQQDDPLPFTVLALVPEISVGDN